MQHIKLEKKQYEYYELITIVTYEAYVPIVI